MIRTEAVRGRKWERGVGDSSYGRGSVPARPQTAEHDRIFHLRTQPPPLTPPRPTSLWARAKIGGLAVLAVLECDMGWRGWSGGGGEVRERQEFLSEMAAVGQTQHEAPIKAQIQDRMRELRRLEQMMNGSGSY